MLNYSTGTRDTDSDSFPERALRVTTAYLINLSLFGGLPTQKHMLAHFRWDHVEQSSIYGSGGGGGGVGAVSPQFVFNAFPSEQSSILQLEWGTAGSGIP